MGGETIPTLLDMLAEDPVRVLPSCGPPALGLALVTNGYVHDTSLLAAVAFAALLVAFSAQITAYQLASFRVEKVAADVGVDRGR